MSTDPRRARAWLALSAVALALACSSSELTVSCAPTPACSLRAERFEPPSGPDAGPMPCDDERCSARAISAGGRHTCGIARAGELFCWGDGSEGQRGAPPPDGPRSDAGPTDAGSAMPDAAVEIDAGPLEARVTEVFALGVRTAEVAAGGAHTCARLENGEVLCWGRNVEGQVLGAATGTPVTEPTIIAGARGATDLAAGHAHTCVVIDGAVSCWGSARFGQSGRMVMDGAVTLGRVAGTDGAEEVTAGVRHACALLASGRVACWGSLVGDDGAATVTPDAVEVSGLEDVFEVTAGGGHTCARQRGGRLVCWGANDSGQLGDGTTRSRAAPLVVRSEAVTLAAGGTEIGGALVGHTCFINVPFHVECWGRNREGQLGDATDVDRLTPIEVLENQDAEETEPLEDVIAVTAGALHTCALDEGGDVFCWGSDSHDQVSVRRPPAPLGLAREVAQFR